MTPDPWTPEPWTTGNADPEKEDFLFDAFGYCIGDGFAKEDLLRLVACVNALAGISDPAAFVAAARELVKYPHASSEMRSILLKRLAAHLEKP